MVHSILKFLRVTHPLGYFSKYGLLGRFHRTVIATQYTQPKNARRLTPPSRHKRKQPLLITRQILQENRRIQHQIASTTKRTQTHKQAQHLPIGARARDNGKHRADNQTGVERNLAPDDVGRHAPEERADQHAHVGCDSQAVGVAGLEFEGGLAGDDGLEEQDERVDGVAEAVEDEELHWVEC